MTQYGMTAVKKHEYTRQEADAYLARLRKEIEAAEQRIHQQQGGK